MKILTFQDFVLDISTKVHHPITDLELQKFYREYLLNCANRITQRFISILATANIVEPDISVLEPQTATQILKDPIGEKKRLTMEDLYSTVITLKTLLK